MQREMFWNDVREQMAHFCRFINGEKRGGSGADLLFSELIINYGN